MGCAQDCRFCLTATGGFERNLTRGEIIAQVRDIKNELDDPLRLTNIVFMGMGEPLMNYNNVLKAIEKVTDASGLGMSPKRITLSTSGLPKLIRKMADDQVQFHLAVSLHSALQSTRESIMPFAQKFPLTDLLAALQHWYVQTKRQVTFEYVVWKGINDDQQHIKALVDFCLRVPSKVNLIEYNAIGDDAFVQAAPEAVEAYLSALKKARITATIRRSRGKDIDAACGQLANKKSGIPV